MIKKEYTKRYYEKNKAAIRARRIIRDAIPEVRKKNALMYKRHSYKVRYGITLEQYEQMKTAQRNQCGICGNVFRDSADVNVDHNHANGKVRQLLCRKCNCALGLLDESYDNALKMADYIKRWQ